ncbi:hypothetical protein [Halorubrum distributum]|uniref:MarR family transcriptional regulator n=1 Tax=Halorubrum distributum TaxID=29283 RepID=A0A6B1IV65_9EURY|nr:hypothetical protein [Halorubrum terrestre]MYL66626.1 hypothetical protein [Halorubrum terrestre]
MYWTSESRAFLSAIHEAGGKATMRDIRHRTDLTEGQRQHQFEKLEDAGYIDVDRVEGLTSNNVAMKMASLTEAAVDDIQRGVLSGKTDYGRRASVDVAELAEDVQTTQQYVSEVLYPRLQELQQLSQRVDELESTS